jgi:hypothetical protein
MNSRRRVNSTVGHLPMKIHKIVALLAVLAAFPFVLVGTFFWLAARAHNYQGAPGLEADEMAGLIFSLGAPLTKLVLRFPDYAGRYLTKRDDWWALPSTVLLFIAQWVIWSQPLALILRGLDRLVSNKRIWSS